MKSFWKKAVAVTAIAAALGLGVPDASATTYQSVASGNTRIGRAVINSATEITGRNLADPSRKVVVYLSSTALVTTTVGTMLSDGTILTSQSIVVSGSYPTSVTFNSPQSAQSVFVSPTGAMTGTNTLHHAVYESK